MSSKSAIEHFSQAIQIKTISNRDETKTDFNEFIKFHEFLKSTYPHVHSEMIVEKISKASLLFTWKAKKQNENEPFAIIGHMDVVPVEKETIEDWKYPPFSGHNDGTMIWGRGANDMKCHIIGLMEALEDLIISGFEPDRDIYICFGHNEEAQLSEGSGARAVAATLKSRGIKFDMLLDEGGAIIDKAPLGTKVPIAAIGLAEKGYANIEVIASAPGGHAAQPSKNTAINNLAKFITYAHDNPLPVNIIDTVSGTIKSLGNIVGGILGWVLKNIWFTKPILKNKLRANNMTGAMIYTTTVPTIINAGTAANVLPQKASVNYNCRMLPGENIQTILDHFKNIAEKLNLSDTLEFKVLVDSPSPMETDINSPNHNLIKDVLADMDNTIKPIPYLVTGATDSREYVQVAKEIFRFYPFKLTLEELATMHSVNERISCDSFIFGIDFFKRFIKAKCNK